MKPLQGSLPFALDAATVLVTVMFVLLAPCAQNHLLVSPGVGQTQAGLRTFAAEGVDAIRFLISAAIVMKAASTLVASGDQQTTEAGPIIPYESPAKTWQAQLTFC